MIYTITGIASLTCAIIVGAILAIKDNKPMDSESTLLITKATVSDIELSEALKELEVCNSVADNSYMRV